MPTYEYRCPDGHRFELFQRMSDTPGASCPTCGAASERIISAGGGFLFKGDGFYITDYRSDSYKQAAKTDQGSTGGGADKAPAGPAVPSDKGSTGSGTPAE